MGSWLSLHTEASAPSRLLTCKSTPQSASRAASRLATLLTILAAKDCLNWLGSPMRAVSCGAAA